jgi:hypothetical protein
MVLCRFTRITCNNTLPVGVLGWLAFFWMSGRSLNSKTKNINSMHFAELYSTFVDLCVCRINQLG